MDGSGNVYVSGYDTNNVFKIEPGRQITEIIDASGDGAGNGLASPRGIAVDGSGNVYVTGSLSDNAFKIELVCGDGEIDPGEECDDGNNDRADGCTRTCQVEPGAQNKDQENCINELSKNFAKVAKAQAKDIAKCIKDGGNNKLTGAIEQCITSDPKGKVDKAKKKTLDKAADKCASDPNDPTFPDFAAMDPNTVNRVAVEKELDLIHQIFGTDLDELGLIVNKESDKDGWKCQSAVAKAVGKCQDAKLSTYNACRKDALKSGSLLSTQDLQDNCMGVGMIGIPDLKTKIDKKCGNGLGGTLDKKCGTTLNDALFPPCAGQDLATCMDQKIECEVCKALNEVDDLSRWCDAFDDEDGSNDSCTGGVLPKCTHSWDGGDLPFATPTGPGPGASSACRTNLTVPATMRAPRTATTPKPMEAASGRSTRLPAAGLVAMIRRPGVSTRRRRTRKYAGKRDREG